MEDIILEIIELKKRVKKKYIYMELVCMEGICFIL